MWHTYDVTNQFKKPSKHIVEHSFLLPVVREVLKFVKKHRSYSPE